MPITNAHIGEDVVIFHHDLVNIYGCTIGDHTRIGPFVEIQKNARIGASCKISSHSFICEGVVIEDEVMIAHGVMFTNSLLPQATNDDGSLQVDGEWELTPPLIRRRASIGSNATIIGGVTVGVEALGVIVYDDLQASEKVKVYDRGINLADDTKDIQKLMVSYRMGDMWAPQLSVKEALLTETEHFIQCINTEQRPATDGGSGLRVVEMLEAASQSMKQRGQPIDLVELRRAS
ncbi:hypothetical protein [Inquilinus sp. OTU3971]|uniref:hypothetical protein n=1 Tax=Inquilinus sp. OTU3971 TaxID=3043855 RepID=UPI00313D3B37